MKTEYLILIRFYWQHALLKNSWTLFWIIISFNLQMSKLRTYLLWQMIVTCNNFSNSFWRKNLFLRAFFHSSICKNNICPISQNFYLPRSKFHMSTLVIVVILAGIFVYLSPAHILEQRQYKKDSIHSKIILVLNFPRFSSYRIGGEKTRQCQNQNGVVLILC